MNSKRVPFLVMNFEGQMFCVYNCHKAAFERSSAHALRMTIEQLQKHATIRGHSVIDYSISPRSRQGFPTICGIHLKLPAPQLPILLDCSLIQHRVVRFLQQLPPFVGVDPLHFMRPFCLPMAEEDAAYEERVNNGVQRFHEFRAALRSHREAPNLSQFSRPDPFHCWPNAEEPPPALGEWMDDWDGNGMNRHPPLRPGEVPPYPDPNEITLQVHVAQCPLASSCGLGHW